MAVAETHLTPEQVECPECEMPAGEPCNNRAFGLDFRMINFHERRIAAALYHEVVRPLPGSDERPYCTECDWEEPA